MAIAERRSSYDLSQSQSALEEARQNRGTKENVQSHQERHHRHRRPHLEGRRAVQARQDHRHRAGPAWRPRVRRHRLLRDARRHRPAHASRNALHGHLFGRRFRERHAGGALRRHDDGGRFLPAVARQSLLEALQMWHNKTSKACADYSFHMAITWWGERCSTRWRRWSTAASPRSSTSWPTRAR